MKLKGTEFQKKVWKELKKFLMAKLDLTRK